MRLIWLTPPVRCCSRRADPVEQLAEVGVGEAAFVAFHGGVDVDGEDSSWVGFT
jgi:hypothetical protein